MERLRPRDCGRGAFQVDNASFERSCHRGMMSTQPSAGQLARASRRMQGVTAERHSRSHGKNKDALANQVRAVLQAGLLSTRSHLMAPVQDGVLGGDGGRGEGCPRFSTLLLASFTGLLLLLSPALVLWPRRAATLLLCTTRTPGRSPGSRLLCWALGAHDRETRALTVDTPLGRAPQQQRLLLLLAREIMRTSGRAQVRLTPKGGSLPRGGVQQSRRPRSHRTGR